MSLIVWYPFHKDLNDWAGDTTLTKIGGGSREGRSLLGKGQTFASNGGYNINGKTLPYKYSKALWVKSGTKNFSNLLSYSAGDKSHVFYASGGNLVASNQWSGPEHRVDVTLPSDVVNRWVHLCCTYDGVTLKVYIDGVLQGQKAMDNPSVGTKLGIGHYGSSNWLNGTLADVRIYDHALSPVEVAELAKGLQAHYTFKGMKPSYENRFRNSSFYAHTELTEANSPSIDWDWSLHQGALNVTHFTTGFNSGSDPDRNLQHCYFRKFQNEVCAYGDNTLNRRWMGISATVFNNADIDPGLDPYKNDDSRRKWRRMVLSVDVYCEDVGHGMPSWRVGLYRPKVGGGNAFERLSTLEPTKSKQWQRLSAEIYVDDEWNWDSTASSSVYFYAHYGPAGPKYFKNPQFEIGGWRANPFAPNTTAERYTTPDDMVLHDVTGLGHDGEVLVGSEYTNKDYTNAFYGHPTIYEPQLTFANYAEVRHKALTPNGLATLWLDPAGNKGYYSSKYNKIGPFISWVHRGYVPPEDDFTFAGWINRRANSASDSVYISCADGWDAKTGGFELGTGWGTTAYGGVGRVRVAANKNIGLNDNDDWQHLAVSYSAKTGITKWYLDGEVKYTHTGSPRQLGDGQGYLKILSTGSSETTRGDHCLGGFADFRVYGTCLAQADIQALMTIKAEVVETGEVHCAELLEGWDDKGELEISVRSTSEENTSGTYLNGVKVGQGSSYRGLNFCIFDTSMTLRGYGNLDCYSGTTSQKYVFDGITYVRDNSNVGSAQAAHNWMMDALDRMEDGWLLSIARDDAITNADGKLFNDYLKPMFGAEMNPAGVATRGTWLLLGIKNGRKLLENWEGRRHNSNGSVQYYGVTETIGGGFYPTEVRQSGVVSGGVLSEVGNVNGLLAFSNFTQTDAPLGLVPAQWTKDAAFARDERGLLEGSISEQTDLQDQAVDEMSVVVRFIPRKNVSGRLGLLRVGEYTHGLSMNYGGSSTDHNAVQVYYRNTDNSSNYNSLSFDNWVLNQPMSLIITKRGTQLEFYQDGRHRSTKTDAKGWRTGGEPISFGLSYTGALRSENYELQICKVFNRALTSEEVYAEFDWLDHIFSPHAAGFDAARFSEI